MNYNQLIAKAKTVIADESTCQQLISLLDLTSLNATDNPESIKQLCDKALVLPQPVAAICTYPEFTQQVKQALEGSAIKTCSVANFPEGSLDIDKTVKQIFSAMLKGAEEIDVVIPYAAYLTEGAGIITTFVKICKQACGNKVLLKVILETGAMQTTEQVFEASKAAIRGGADFIKTSTGKIAVNATLEASAIMLSAIKESNSECGFKAAGGIRTRDEAAGYLYLAQQIIGNDWVKPANFRIGASVLLDHIIELGYNPQANYLHH